MKFYADLEFSNRIHLGRIEIICFNLGAVQLG